MLALTDRVQIERLNDAADGAGNSQERWEKMGAIIRAHIAEGGGGEAVMAAKLQGRQTCTVTVRASQLTRAITPNDRLIDVANNRPLKIRHAPPPGREGYIAMLCEAGVAT